MLVTHACGKSSRLQCIFQAECWPAGVGGGARFKFTDDTGKVRKVSSRLFTEPSGGVRWALADPKATCLTGSVASIVPQQAAKPAVSDCIGVCRLVPSAVLSGRGWGPCGTAMLHSICLGL